MDAIVVGIILLCILIVFYYGTQEHMTNADLLDTLRTFGEQTPKKEKKSETGLPIEGPEAKSPEHPTPAPSSKKGKDSDSALYPHIYGPDMLLTPGKTNKGDDEEYSFNPHFENAFPVNGPPQPFLGDFSKFQR